MKTVKICALALVGGLLAHPNLEAAIVGSTGTITISAPGLAYNDVDGPYNVVTTSVTSGVNVGSFQTFCLGSQVDYYSGGTYSYEIDTAVQPFYDEANANPPNLTPPSAKTYVALGTAYLYSQFLAGNIGTLGSYDSGNDAIQEAIWYLQGQTYGVDNQYVALASAAVGAGNLENDADGAYGIYAFNLSPGNAPGDAYNYAQPQLVQVLPEPGTIFAAATLLIPFCVGSLRMYRQTKRITN